MTSATDNNVFKSKYTSTVAFAVGVLLFLLPFVEVRCNGATVAQNTGIGLATGSDYELGEQMKSMQETYGNKKSEDSGVSNESGKLYEFALAALLLGAVGLVLTLVNKRNETINMILGGLAAIALVALMLQVQSDIRSKQGPDPDDQFSKSMKMTAHFTFAYYLAIVSFLAAAFFSYKRRHLALSGDTEVPPNAPQLDLGNPGDQSDFPKSPTESTIG